MGNPVVVQKATPVFSSGTPQITFGSQPAVGNLVVLIAYGFAALGTPTDNRANSYTVQSNAADGNTNNVAIATAKVATTGSPFQITAGAGFEELFAYEISGWDGTTVLDGAALAANDGSVGASTGGNLGTITTTRDGALIFEALIDQSTKLDWTASVNGSAATQQDYQTANVDANVSWIYNAGAPRNYTPAVFSATNASTFAAVAVAIKAATVPPAITQQPGSLVINAGDYWYGQTAATDSTGGGLTYQWQVNTGSGFSNIGGATSSSYATAALTTGDTGTQYRCNVTNSVGTTATNAATVTVLAKVAATLGDFDPGLRTLGWW